ncbi:hypothetical protein HALLA_18700 [Halostagnicola larsenii XH-48]|uniref:DUF7967 domain-containing protein n=1 Tax=Halostagnicola larsenii XH-48 TaxID=797299 RepID=W0JP66_9EURY|nr:hypothetical protein [Halostagnicola larsenii]AHG00516.1 hypothetical protein HALLA_18700 [Halostagnicola larsenii XH-48]
MSDSTVRCWLVERTFDDRNLVTIVYATPDGSKYHQRERSAMSLQQGSAVTAAADVDPDELEAVTDEETRERYASEVERTANAHEPDEEI